MLEYVEAGQPLHNKNGFMETKNEDSSQCFDTAALAEHSTAAEVWNWQEKAL